MRLPRDVSGERLARLLRRYGYEFVRQSGSYIRLTATIGDTSHHVTIPDHPALGVGLLADIVSDVAAYLRDRESFSEELFS